MQLQQGTGTSAKEIETSQGISQQNGLCYFQRVGTRGVNMSICHLIVTCIFISYNLRDNKIWTDFNTIYWKINQVKKKILGFRNMC
jgi:hypothetical protein